MSRTLTRPALPLLTALILASVLLTACGNLASDARPSTADTAPAPVAASSSSTATAPATSETVTAPAPAAPVQSAPAPFAPASTPSAAHPPAATHAPSVARSAAPAAPSSQPAPVAVPQAPALPLPYAGPATQLITVVVSSRSSTTATVTGWSRTNAGWQAVIGPVQGKVGSDGVGTASESASRTPAGVYGLSQAFGRQANPGAHLPYFQTNTADWWDENPGSPTYNTHVRQQSSPGGASENLYNTGAVYDYVVNINYNTARTPGAGSAIFLHVTNGAPTAGCVAVPRATMVSILKWLDPGARPAITIGVG